MCSSLDPKATGTISIVVSFLLSVTCDAFLYFSNGEITYSTQVIFSGYTFPRYSMDTVATFTCDDGYELEGPRTRTCASLGNWDRIEIDTTCNKEGNKM